MPDPHPIRTAAICGCALAFLSPSELPAQSDIAYGELAPLEGPGPLENDPLIDGPGAGITDSYFAWKKGLAEDTGFNYLIEYGLINQWADHGYERFHADHELNVSGMWDLTDTGKLMWWYQNSLTLGDVTTGDFNRSLGALSPVNGGDTSPELNANRLQLLAWEQRFADDRFRLVFGKLTTRVLMNLNRYAVSDREDFYTPMLVNNPVVPYTARIGVGVFGEYRTDSWYLSGMFRDADADEDFIDIDSIGSGNWEYAAEIGLTPTLGELGEGIYRLTVHYTDGIGSGESFQPPGWSFAASFDQDLGDSIGAFFRYSYANQPLRAFQQRAALGAQIKGPFEHPDDRIGLAGWWGRPTDGGLREEFGLELFYKLQLAQNIELTPDLMLVFDPALEPSRNTALIGGLRMRIEF